MRSASPLSAVAGIALFAASAASAHAGTASFSLQQPVFDSNDITQLQTGTLATAPESLPGGVNNDNARYIANDRPAQGQTFTVVEAGLQVQSITLQTSGAFRNIPEGSQITLRINTVVGTTLTTIYTDVAPLAASPFTDNAPVDYFTFVLATPLPVSPGLTYGFDFGNTAGNPTNGGGGFYFRLDGAPDTAYTGGTAYSSGDRSGFGNTTAVYRETDRTFAISLIPEPSVALLAIMSGAGVLGLVRRRA
jgi:hypothetical protein